jgi:hypothetical protein
MPSEQLIAYVRECLAKGFTKEQLSRVLLNSGYAEPDVSEVLDRVEAERNQGMQKPEPQPAPRRKPDENAVNWFAYVVIIAGMMLISFVLTIPILFLSGFGRWGTFGTYSALLFIGLIVALALYKLAPPFIGRDSLVAIAGVLTPILSMGSVIFVFGLIRRITLLSLQNVQVSNAIHPIFQVLGRPHSPFIASIFYFLASNSLIIYYLYKKQNTQAMLWYALLIPLYALTWMLASGFASSIIERAL